jgi:hypothetical protein
MFCFMETAHEPLHLDKLSLVQSNIMDIRTNFIWIIILFDKAYKRGNVAEFWGYVGTDAGPLYVKTLQFLPCYIFVIYLICC